MAVRVIAREADKLFLPLVLPCGLTRRHTRMRRWSQVREDAGDYLGECLAVDKGIGVLLEELEARGELENTLIIASGKTQYHLCVICCKQICDSLVRF